MKFVQTYFRSMALTAATLFLLAIVAAACGASHFLATMVAASLIVVLPALTILLLSWLFNQR